MKTVIITESQMERLFEAADDFFSLEELDAIPSFAGRLKYCREHLGSPVGKGSSKIVFQIDDDKVLKLASNKKGIAQNMEEGNDYLKAKSPVFPHVYEHSDDDKWIVSEYVLPCKDEDFVEVFGVPFNEFCLYVITSAKNCYYTREVDKLRGVSYQDFSNMLENSDNFCNINQYIADYNPPVGDLLRIVNYGLTMRDGEPYIVILDSGLTYDIYNTFYKKQRTWN